MPSAPRTAISRLRFSARTRSRLETFTQAMTEKPAPAKGMSRIGRMSPTMRIA